MMKRLIIGIMGAMSLVACNQEKKQVEDNFNYTVEQFADLQLLRFKVHGFEELPLKQKLTEVWLIVVHSLSQVKQEQNL